MQVVQHWLWWQVAHCGIWHWYWLHISQALVLPWNLACLEPRLLLQWSLNTTVKLSHAASLTICTALSSLSFASSFQTPGPSSAKTQLEYAQDAPRGFYMKPEYDKMVATAYSSRSLEQSWTWCTSCDPTQRAAPQCAYHLHRWTCRGSLGAHADDTWRQHCCRAWLWRCWWR